MTDALTIIDALLEEFGEFTIRRTQKHTEPPLVAEDEHSPTFGEIITPAYDAVLDSILAGNLAAHATTELGINCSTQRVWNLGLFLEAMLRELQKAKKEKP